MPVITGEMLADLWYYARESVRFGLPLLLIGLAFILVPQVIDVMKSTFSKGKRSDQDDEDEDYYYII